MHDPKLIDLLSAFPSERFDGIVYRATLSGRDPLRYSTAGGRWMARDGMAVLYTSLDRDGAVAEVAYRLSQLTPIPSKPIRLHTLKIRAHRLLQIEHTQLAELGIPIASYPSLEYARCQAVGAAVGWLQHDALRVPSARWSCDNIVLFSDHSDFDCVPELVASEDFDWKLWAVAHGMIAGGDA